MAEYSNGLVTYRIDSQRVSLSESMRILGDKLRQRGRQTLVLVLMDERISFEQMQTLKGVLDKAGAGNARYFVFTSDRSRMQRLHFERGIPYSSNPSEISSGLQENY